MDWMSLNEHRGKISCSCNEKLGHYDWGGRVCKGMSGRPCGTAVRPWIYVNQSKVDRSMKIDQNVSSPINNIIIRPQKFPCI
nr:Bm13315 [Brugia malayi]